MNVFGKRTLGSSRDADDGHKTTIAIHSIADLTAGEQVSLILNTILNHTVVLEYFNIKFEFCLPVFLDIHRHPKQKEFFKCYDAFLRAAPTGHGHPTHF